jgi:hypothetical protein
MANKVTNEDILRINELYYKHKVYAEVARQTGFSASTVKKYVIPNWAPVASKNIIRFDIAQLPNFTSAAEIFRGVSNYGNLCTLTDYEKEEVEKLWEELPV